MIAVKHKADFTEGKIFSKIVWFVLPIVLTNLLQAFYNAADMMVVSLSDEANAVGAVGTTGSYITLIVNIFMGFSIGANVVVARHIGEKNEKKTERSIHTALVLALIFGLVGGAIGMAASRPILVAMGNRGNLLELAVTYTHFYFAGVPFLALTNYLIAIFRAKGDSKTPLVVLASTGLLNVVLNFFFVVVFGMSVEGVALATAIANLASCIILLTILSKSKDCTAFSFKKLKIDRKELRAIIRIGVPSAIQQALFAISNMLIQSSIVTVNNNVCPPDSVYQPIVNGCAAGSNLTTFVYTAQNAVAQGAITFASQNVGAEKPKRVYKVIGYCSLLVTAIGFTLGSFMYLCREPLLALYGVKGGAAGSLESIAMSAASTQLKYVSIPYFLCGIMEIGSFTLRGLGRSVQSMLISLIGSCLLRVVWLLTVFPLKQTLEVIYICYTITWILTSIVLFIWDFLLISKLIKEKKQKDTSYETVEKQEQLD